MCGIFGLIVKENSDYDYKFIKKLTEDLALFSESRGKESAGFSIYNPAAGKFSVIKGAETVSKLINEGKFDKFFLEANELKEDELNSAVKNPFALTGHSRLVTNGTQLLDFNNQPVIKDGIVGIHNGIITNVDDIWESFTDLNREFEVDTEVLLSLIRQFINDGSSLPEAFVKVFNLIKGAASIAFMFNDKNCLALVTNCGSLYKINNSRNDTVIFASEEYFLKELMNINHIRNMIGEHTIKQVHAFTGYLYNIKTLEHEFIKTKGPYEKKNINFDTDKKLAIDYKPEGKIKYTPPHISASHEAHLKSLLKYDYENVSKLRRCTKCLLPETFPFIKYDDKGVCNICNNYKPMKNPKTLENLIELVEPYRRKNGATDCIVPFSGGRDSSYSLHVIKKELKLNPITITYDWGMVTDLARRNIARVTGKLGVENILVSADIKMKRENIGKNVTAWLKKPALGLIPLFMIGDKYFFYHTMELRKKTGVKLNLWGSNKLENTDFKVGFCGVPLNFNKKRIDSLKLKNIITLMGFYGKNFLGNPGYLNSSLYDTIGAFVSRYMTERKDYYHFFDYVQWDEHQIESTIINEYEWETAPDTKSTWRIGDGTAGFYNYIYYSVAGFSEIDTFRSNQIREGMITREEGMKFIQEENAPRYESLKFYFDTINVDFESAIKIINNIPKLYRDKI
jgi:asparagine synthetase B (glutamine-hydrolysing)